MTRSQFRFLVVINQLLLLVAIFVQRITDKTLPPELRSYLGIDQSVFDTAGVAASTDISYWVAKIILVTGVIAAIGLCFGKRWGRTLFLLTSVAGVISALLPGFFFDTGWTIFVSSLAGITEGMILGLAYFSHVRRMFEPAEEI